MSKQGTIVICWLAVLALGGYLRFDGLAKRPFHADEATGARIAASRMETGNYRFDPVHYHGPLLANLAIPLAKLRGEGDWRRLTKLTPRLSVAACGTALLLVPLLFRRRLGEAGAVLAAALLATSPLLVYYSRMFIHEMPLTLFGLAALACVTTPARLGLGGVCVGLMFATKETFAISILAWTGAAVVVAWENRRELAETPMVRHWRNHRQEIMMFAAAAAVVSMAFYTDGFRKVGGAIDAFRTFFVYETVSGHDKPFAYYFRLVALPVKSGGIWWYGTPVVMLALIGYLSTFQKDAAASRGRFLIRFIAYSAVIHFLIYSAISYKTPWLACLPWAHVCVLAGTAVVGFTRRGRWVQALLALLILSALGSQFHQARQSIGRLASDDRNPFAYVPTSRDVENIAPWLQKLRAAAPAGPLAVIGSDYWPLPWYLRGFEGTGYWPVPPEGMEKMPVVLVTPEMQEVVSHELDSTHRAVPRGLRAGAPLLIFIRNDVWERWMENGS